MRTLTLVFCLIASSALAQVTGLCGAGRNCDVARLTTSRPSGILQMCENVSSGTGSWGWLATLTANSLYTYAGARCSGAATERYGFATTLGLYSTSAVASGAGTAAAPAFTFMGDTNTGLYNVGADQLGVSTAGARSFNFSATAGTLEGTSGNASLSMTNNFSASTTGLVSLNGASGVKVLTGALTPTGFGADAQTFYADANTNALWFAQSTTRASTPPFTLGGGSHWVLQRRTYTLDVGVESSATPTWNPAPRVGASTVSMTMSDAAAAGATTLGSSPYLLDVRTSVTTAAAGSTSSAIASTAFVRRDHGPQWCQTVAVSDKTTARLWLGLSTALPGSSDTPAATDFVAFRQSSDASDTNLQLCSKDGTTQSCSDAAVPISTGTTAPQVLCIDCREGSACTAWVDGVARVRKTTNLPTATVKLAPFWSIEARAASARTLYAGPKTVELR